MDYLEEFLDYLRVERGLSPHTIAAYKKDVERFLLYFRGDILKTDPRTLSDFLKKERGENKEPATLARRISGLRRFFRFLLGEGLMKEDPTGNLRSPRLGLHLPDVLSMEEVERLLHAPTDSPAGIRERAILEVLYATGLRVSELATLRKDDVNLEVGFLKCFGKRSRERMVPLGEKSITALKHYMKTREGTLPFLFLSSWKKPFTRTGLWKLIKRLARKAGILKNIS